MKADLSKGFVLGGTSAGGNFAVVLSHLAVLEEINLPLTVLLLIVTSVCHPDVCPEKYRDRILSMDEIADVQGLLKEQIEYFDSM